MLSQPTAPSSLNTQEDLNAPELSIIMPCLNEADTIENCVRIAVKAMQDHGIKGEVVIGDNGSTDGSPELAIRQGARVVSIKEKGYGAALQGGIAACRGRFILMGDADESYDFAEAFKFVAKLREGYDLVQGCRLPSGGGKVISGAMPPSHRWIGNPAFSMLARTMFGVPIHDIYCGMRAFTKELYASLELRCSGMEFANEMIIKSSLMKARIAEVPITLHPDGRKAHGPHLRTIRDGWRTLRFYLLYSPRWLFLIPGIGLMLFGALAYVLAITHTQLGGPTLSVHTLLVGVTAILLGFTTLFFALIAKTFGIRERLLPPDPRLDAFYAKAKLEYGLLLGLGSGIAGIACIAVVLARWREGDFGSLPFEETVSWVGTGLMLLLLGAQTIFSSFVISLIGIDRK